MAEYCAAPKEAIVAVPNGVSAVEACGAPVAGITAFQSIVPRVEKGDRLFINGGSGGVGSYGIQIAKVVGCHVTTTCSGRNVEFCRELGADEVVDYTKGNVVEVFKEKGWKFDHVVDNVGTNDELVWRCGEYLNEGAVYVKVSSDLSLHSFVDSWKRKFTPGFLGGVRRKVEGFWPSISADDLRTLAGWIGEEKVKAIVDHEFKFEEAPQAFEKLKTGRARGKIVVEVASET